MHADNAADVGEHGLELSALDGHLLVVGLDGIHVYGRFAAEFLLEPALNEVDLIVQLKNIASAVDLRVKAYHQPARAVIVHHEVVHTYDRAAAHHELFYVFDKLRIRRLTQQRGECVLCHAIAREKDEQRDQHSGVAVYVHLEYIRNAHRNQHHSRCYRIGKAVGARCHHRGGAYLFAHAPVVQAHIDLHADGRQQYRRRKQPNLDGLGADYLPDGACKQLNAHDDYHSRHSQAAYVLYPAVAEGVIRVGLLAREPEAQQGDNRRSGVGKVVEGVGGYGYGAGDHSGHVFAREQQNIQEYAQQAAQAAVGIPYGGV